MPDGAGADDDVAEAARQEFNTSVLRVEHRNSFDVILLERCKLEICALREILRQKDKG